MASGRRVKLHSSISGSGASSEQDRKNDEAHSGVPSHSICAWRSSLRHTRPEGRPRTANHAVKPVPRAHLALRARPGPLVLPDPQERRERLPNQVLRLRRSRRLQFAWSAPIATRRLAPRNAMRTKRCLSPIAVLAEIQRFIRPTAPRVVEHALRQTIRSLSPA